MSELEKFHVGEAELLAVAAGDRVAFGLLYDRLSPCVFGLLVRMVAERLAAEKALLTVFSQIWQSAPTFNPARGTARRFVFDIAYRCAVAQRTVAAPAAGVADVLELAFFEGLSAQQIAARTGATLASVRASMRSGIDRLRIVGEPAT